MDPSRRAASGVRTGGMRGRGELAVLWLLLAGSSAATAQRAGAPVAILSQMLVGEDVWISQEDPKITRMGAVGELLFPGDRVRGSGGVVAECRGNGSVRWLLSPSTVYVAGKGTESTDSNGKVILLTAGTAPAPLVKPIPDCRMPEAALPANLEDVDAKAAGDGKDRLRKAAITTDYNGAALKGLVEPLPEALPGYNAHDGMWVLRLAQAIEDRKQLWAAIQVYARLLDLWDKPGWVLAKIARLENALAKNVLDSPAKPRSKHVTPLVIGVSGGVHADPGYLPLHYAGLDGQAFAAYLEQIDTDLKKIGPEQKFALINCHASQAQIRQRLSQIQSQSGDGSTAVVFVSSHGFQNISGSFIATYDVYQRDAADTAVSIAEILRAVSGFERAYVFVDACRTKNSARTNNVNAVLNSYGHELPPPPGVPPPPAQMFILASAKPGGWSDEEPQFSDKQGPLAQAGHGAFTYHLLKVLYDSRTDQPLTRRQLEQELNKKMLKLKLPQMPDFGGPLGVDAPLDPIKKIPFKREVGTTSFLDLFRAPIRLAFYAPEQQADVTQETIERLRAILGRGAINPLVAQQTMEAYRRQSQMDQMQWRSTIRIALEDEGERLLLNYLDGYQLEPDRNQFHDANLYYTLASELAPESLLLRARAAFNAGRYRLFDLLGTTNQQQRASIFHAATQDLFDAYRDDPGPYVLNALGIAYMENGEWDNAILAFDGALGLAPQWLYPKHNRALSLMRSGKAQKAIEEYRKAIAEMPSAHTLHFNLALAYQQINELKQAEREYDETTRLLGRASGVRNVDWARLYNAQGTLAAQRGQKGKAMGLYDKALEKADMLEARHNKALISSPRAEQERLLAQNRGYLGSRIELAQMLKDDGHVHVREAIAEYEGIIREREDFAGARLDLALLYLRGDGTAQERLRKASDQMEKATEPMEKAEPAQAQRRGQATSITRPEFWKLSLVKAEVARVQGQDTEAKANYREARQHAPDRAARREIAESEKGKWLH